MSIKSCERLAIQAYSGIEELAQISFNGEVDPALTWMVEPFLSDNMPALVANAIVTPFKQGEITTVPVRLINPLPQAVVIDKGMKLAQMCIVRTVDLAMEDQPPMTYPYGT